RDASALPLLVRAAVTPEHAYRCPRRGRGAEDVDALFAIPGGDELVRVLAEGHRVHLPMLIRRGSVATPLDEGRTIGGVGAGDVEALAAQVVEDLEAAVAGGDDRPELLGGNRARQVERIAHVARAGRLDHRRTV